MGANPLLPSSGAQGGVHVSRLLPLETKLPRGDKGGIIAFVNQSNEKWKLASMNIPFDPMNLYLTYGHSLNVLKILTFYKIPILYCLRLSPKLDFISTKPIHFKMQRIKIEQGETQMSRHALCLQPSLT